MYIKIYIPTKIEAISAYCEDIAKKVSNLFDGCTIIPNCRGYYKDFNKPLAIDKITIIEAYTHDTWLNIGENYVKFMEILVKIKRDLKQDAVAYCIDNQIHYI